MSSGTSFEALTSNLSWAAVPAALALGALPHWYTIYLAEKNKVQGGWSNVNPRGWIAQLNAKAATGKRLSPVEQTILRGQACQLNAFENVPLFALTVVFANVARLDKPEINRFIVTYLITRLLFTILYLRTENYWKSFIRTGVFNVGVLYIIRIWIKAGFKYL
jgi:uncharacterized MAPEG superfamily protein